MDKPTPRSYTDISQPLRDAKEKGLITNFIWYREPRREMWWSTEPIPPTYVYVDRFGHGSRRTFKGDTIEEAYDKAAAYVATLEKPVVTLSTKDHVSDYVAYSLQALKELAVTEKTEYLHLRCYDLDNHEFMQTGGITLAYIREGKWYKVGAAFCSLKDMYQKDGVVNGKEVGRRLAKARLWTAPAWIHEEDWLYHSIPSRLTCKEGRAWFDHAMRKGLSDWWDMRPVGKGKPTQGALGDDWLWHGWAPVKPITVTMTTDPNVRTQLF